MEAKFDIEVNTKQLVEAISTISNHLAAADALATELEWLRVDWILNNICLPAEIDKVFELLDTYKNLPNII